MSSHTFPCPHCGADVPAGAHFCRHCGADEQVGWSDQSAGSYEGYDDDFDYDDFVQREFPEHAVSRADASSFGKTAVIVLLCIALALLAIL